MNISPFAIRTQLERILRSEAFVRSHRMQRFLRFIVEETLAGRSECLGEYSVGLAVFDREADFEPALDPIVRNDARRLRMKLLEYYNQSGPADAVTIEIPKGGYTPVFRPTTAAVDPVLDSSRRLAVFPFEVLSSSPAGAMHGRSLCMQLTANLTNVDGLEAVAHGYVQQRPIREAASELRLSHAIHGSVVEAGDRCRVIVNLIQISAGTQMWAKEFEFEAGHVLNAQSEIAASVRREVTSRLGLMQRPALVRAA